jgi:hypothetical protein
MWQQTKLLGRDHLLSRQVTPRIKEGRGFVLTGRHGSGKTAILEWIVKNTPGKIALVSAANTVKEILMEICVAWKIDVQDDSGKSKGRTNWLVAWMERAVLQQTEGLLLIDDIHQAPPALLRRLKLLRDRVTIIAAGVPPFKREELRRILWGLPEIHVKSLAAGDMTRIARAAAPVLQSRTSIADAVHAARGMPGQLLAALRGEITPDSAKVQGEELDLSPLLLVVLAGVMMTRYLAHSLESSSLYLLGGIGMSLGIIFRFYMFRGMENRRK